MTSLVDLLKYSPPEAFIVDKNKGRTSTKLTVPANPRELNDCSVQVWDAFDDDIIGPFEQRVAPYLKQLVKVFTDVDRPVVSSENGVQSVIYNYICYPVIKIFKHLGQKIQIESGEGRLCGNPDISVQLIVDATSRDLIPAEVKTMWAFDVGQELCDILNDQGSSDYKVVYKVVSQIYGYMSINHCKYGILCTYDKFYFLKRDGSQPRSTLLISKMVHRCSDGPITVIKALSALIYAACDDHFYSSPYSTPPFARKQILEDAEKSPGYQKVFVYNRQLYVHKMLCRNSQSSILLGGFTRDLIYQRVIKLVDVAKCPVAAACLAREVQAYQQLEGLQGSLIPRFYGYIDLSGQFDCLLVENLGDGLEDADCTGMELPIIGYVKDILVQIHQLGVAHGDIALRNVIINRDFLEAQSASAIKIIDFGHCSIAGDDVDFAAACQKDLRDADKLFVR